MDFFDSTLYGDMSTSFPGVFDFPDINYNSVDTELPTLPAPPSLPPSPFPISASPPASALTKRKRPRKPEVDQADVVTTSRMRIPSKRAAGAQAIESQAKKNKIKKVCDLFDSFVCVLTPYASVMAGLPSDRKLT